MKKNIETFIEEHKHINYCEAIIYPDGLIEYAIPSHIETLIRITNESRDIIYEKMPLTASPIHWLTEYTKCISVWYEGHIIPKTYTKKQMDTLTKLINNDIILENKFS